jgi:hypothetical protein
LQDVLAVSFVVKRFLDVPLTCDQKTSGFDSPVHHHSQTSSDAHTKENEMKNSNKIKMIAAGMLIGVAPVASLCLVSFVVIDRQLNKAFSDIAEKTHPKNNQWCPEFKCTWVEDENGNFDAKFSSEG